MQQVAFQLLDSLEQQCRQADDQRRSELRRVYQAERARQQQQEQQQQAQQQQLYQHEKEEQLEEQKEQKQQEHQYWQATQVFCEPLADLQDEFLAPPDHQAQTSWQLLSQRPLQ